MPLSTLLTTVMRPPTGVKQVVFTGGVQIDTPSGVAATVPRQTATQGDGLAIPGGYGVWPAATNLNDNGNATTNTTGITDNSSTTTQVTSGAVKFGSTAFEVVSGNAAANEGPSQAIDGGLAGTQYTVSAWAWLVSGAATVRATLSDSVAGKQGGTAVVLTATPQKVQVTATTGALALNEASYIETTVQQAGTWRIGGWQVETGPVATPYIETDGGTASRTAGRVQIPVAGLFTPTQGWWAAWVRWGFPSTAEPGTGAPRLLDWADDGSNLLLLYYEESSNKISQGRGGGSFGAAQTAAQTFAVGDIVFATGDWSATTLGVSVNGGSRTTLGQSSIPALTSSTLDVGRANASAANWIDSNALCVITGKGALSNADVATMHSWGNIVPSLSQIAMLSAGSQPTALIDCKTADVTLLPGYFS